MSFKDNEPIGSFFTPIKNALSLFNGISALHLALDRAGIEINTCYYAEIDKYANKITEHHYPDDVALGDVTRWREWNIDWSSIDLVGAGFPCQAWSVAGQQQGDKDERGMLFWTTLEIIKHVLYFNPKAKFLMENVKMKKDFEEYITHHTTQALGYVEKTLINSALVSAQNRNRYYWTNFEVTQPRDKGILLKDILENGDFADREKSLTITTRIAGATAKRYLEKSMHQMAICKITNVNPSGRGMNGNVYHTDAKSPKLTTNKGEGIKITGGAIRGRYNEDGSTSQRLELNGTEKTNSLTTVQKDNVAVYEDMTYRKLTPLECERLQTFPDGWTDCVSNTQRYKALGNAWTVDVIAHIFKCMQSGRE